MPVTTNKATAAVLLALLLSFQSAVPGAFASAPENHVRLRCVSGKIRIPSLEGDRTESADYCYSLKPWMLLSNNCEGDHSCGIKTAIEKRKVSLQRSISHRGTPGSGLCMELGGLAQVIEFSVDSGWEKLNRCMMPDDGSFADLATLDRWTAQL